MYLRGEILSMIRRGNEWRTLATDEARHAYHARQVMHLRIAAEPSGERPYVSCWQRPPAICRSSLLAIRRRSGHWPRDDFGNKKRTYGRRVRPA
jgi:hypothetical protein